MGNQEEKLACGEEGLRSLTGCRGMTKAGHIRLTKRQERRTAARELIGYWTTRGCHRRLYVLSFRSFGGM